MEGNSAYSVVSMRNLLSSIKTILNHVPPFPFTDLSVDWTTLEKTGLEGKIKADG